MQKLFVLTLWPTSQASVYNVGHSILCFELAKVFQSKLQMTKNGRMSSLKNQWNIH